MVHGPFHEVEGDLAAFEEQVFFTLRFNILRFWFQNR